MILSDSHGSLGSKAVRSLMNSDIVIFAGDFADSGTYDLISAYSNKLYAVRGNCDCGLWAEKLPRSLIFRIEDVTFYLIHNRDEAGYIPEGIDVVIHGHTHVHSDRTFNGIRFLNPGSVSRPRGDGTHYMIMTVEGDRISVEVENC